MSPRLISLILAASAVICSAQPRIWKSSDGTHSMQGEFVKRDKTTVTLRNDKGTEITVALAKLHPDETKWLDLHHSIDPAGAEPDPNAVFDTLKFGDSRDQALAKLKASKIVEMISDEAFIGRSGMNGVFKTRQKIGKLPAFLYFDWDGDGGLKELTLQTVNIPSENYESEFEPSWKEFVNLINTLYGKPVQSGPMPSMQSIPDGSLLPSHLWALENGTSILLGTARAGEKYQLVVRFTQKKVRAVEIP